MDKQRPLGREIHLTSSAIECYISRNITGSDPAKLTGIEAMTLGFLFKLKKPGTMRDVMNHFHIAKATASQTLTNLERKGMILQKTSENDKRKKMIYLTENGKKIKENYDQKFEVLNAIIEEGITEEEKEVFRKVVLKIRCNIGRDY